MARMRPSSRSRRESVTARHRLRGSAYAARFSPAAAWRRWTCRERHPCRAEASARPDRAAWAGHAFWHASIKPFETRALSARARDRKRVEPVVHRLDDRASPGERAGMRGRIDLSPDLRVAGKNIV